MEGTAQTLYWFQNEIVKIEVPFFQRPYVWDEEDWNELIESINSATYSLWVLLISSIISSYCPSSIKRSDSLQQALFSCLNVQ